MKKIYDEQEVDINKKMAGMMLSAIISDSLLFKSPTCTLQDKLAAEELATIAGVNLEEYGIAMLKAGANTKDKSIKELIGSVSYTHLRAHETKANLVCRLLLEKKK